MNYQKIYEADNQQQQQQPQGMDFETFKKFVTEVNEVMTKVAEALSILSTVKYFYLNKDQAANNVQAATQQMSVTATGAQDTSQQDLQVIEQTFTKYEQLANTYAQLLSELGQTMASLVAKTTDEKIKAFLTKNSQEMSNWKNYIASTSQTFHNQKPLN